MANNISIDGTVDYIPIWTRATLEYFIRMARKRSRYASTGQVERWEKGVEWWKANPGESVMVVYNNRRGTINMTSTSESIKGDRDEDPKGNPARP